MSSRAIAPQKARRRAGLKPEGGSLRWAPETTAPDMTDSPLVPSRPLGSRLHELHRKPYEADKHAPPLRSLASPDCMAKLWTEKYARQPVCVLRQIAAQIYED
jgi:hypothetical protein